MPTLTLQKSDFQKMLIFSEKNHSILPTKKKTYSIGTHLATKGQQRGNDFQAIMDIGHGQLQTDLAHKGLKANSSPLQFLP